MFGVSAVNQSIEADLYGAASRERRFVGRLCWLAVAEDRIHEPAPVLSKKNDFAGIGSTSCEPVKQGIGLTEAESICGKQDLEIH